MDNNAVGAVAAFAVGAVICFGNFKLSEFFLKKHKDRFKYVSFIRQFIQVLYILVLFFVAPYTPWDRTFLLIGAALGITLPMFPFTYKLLKTNNSDRVQTEKEKEEESKDG